MNQYSGIERKLDAVATAVKSLNRTSDKAAKEQKRDRKRIPFDVDTLTSEEVDALKRLIEHERNPSNIPRPKSTSEETRFAECTRSSIGSGLS